ncbi:hypothetical protein RYZ26_00275 [Terasakiella sp. A23]|uniref:hypothetical protein n=1 Tax=Terasakiella sp. FCG-A23 TaxID=3080561 RepID=UPI00295507DC|nr:hypothetical protein [Terasakiella sp. A23]MDV7338008.1 hypothetical protein [Terasakiella sp. A23]
MKKFALNLGVILGAGLTLSACQTAKMAENAATLDVAFNWQNTKACSGVSPAFQIGNIPAGTETLSFRMTDLNKLSFNHGGGTVKYSGSGDIAQGAFGYTGPCPPSGQHNYRWTVQALDKSGELILGEGKATKAFPPN